MSIAISTGLGLAIAGVGAVAGGVVGAVGASSAAGAQSNASMNAAQLQSQNQQASLAEQAREFNTNQQNLAPWMQAGQQSLGTLSNLLGIGGQQQAAPGTVPGAMAPRGVSAQPQPGGLPQRGGNLMQPAGAAGAGILAGGARPPASPLPAGGGLVGTGGGAAGGVASPGGYGSLLQGFNQQFQAPTAAQAAATPGYQFQLQQGEQAIQNSAAARGGLLSGNTMQALDQYSQGLASSNYQQTYNNALSQYQQSYNIFQGNQTNEFNRLAALSGVGQTAATTLGQQGQAAATNIANINSAAGSQIGNSLQNAGAARASGYAGISNAINGGISNISQYALLNNLLNPGASNTANPSAATVGYG